MTPLGALIFHNFHAQRGCVANNGFCPSWIWHHLSLYGRPLRQHVELTVVAVAVGFLIAFTLALIAHRRRWLIAPITGVTGVLYTIPSLAAFFLLLPITGRGFLTAEIALTAYTLLIIFRNVTEGLDAVPDDSRDAARGVGLTDRQLLLRVELPLALPAIFAGLRVAATTTVALATLAVFAGAGGLGEPINAQFAFKSNVVTAGVICVLLAIVLDVALRGAEWIATPWARVSSR